MVSLLKTQFAAPLSLPACPEICYLSRRPRGPSERRAGPAACVKPAWDIGVQAEVVRADLRDGSSGATQWSRWDCVPGAGTPLPDLRPLLSGRRLGRTRDRKLPRRPVGASDGEVALLQPAIAGNGSVLVAGSVRGRNRQLVRPPRPRYEPATSLMRDGNRVGHEIEDGPEGT